MGPGAKGGTGMEGARISRRNLLTILFEQTKRTEKNMQKVSRTLISVSVLAVCTVSFGTVNAPSRTSSPSASGELVALTKALEGKWSLSVKFEPNSSAANGLVSTGEETWRPGP